MSVLVSVYRRLKRRDPLRKLRPGSCLPSKTSQVRPSSLVCLSIMSSFYLFPAYTLSPSLNYPNPHSLPPLSHTTASITRLFLLHDIAHIRQKSSSDEDFAKALEPLETFFDTLQMPSDFPQLLGTKVVRRPGELSSGEYHMLKQVIIMKMMTDNKESADKWLELLKVTKKVLN